MAACWLRSAGCRRRRRPALSARRCPLGSSPPCRHPADRSPRAPGQRDVSHPLTPVCPPDEKARDPPIGQLLQALTVRLLVLDPRQLAGRPELTPANAVRAVINDRSMRPVLPHPGVLELPPLLGGVNVRPAFRVEVQAPAPGPHTVVILHQPGEVRPSLRIQRLRDEIQKLRHGAKPPTRGESVKIINLLGAGGQQARGCPRSCMKRPGISQTATDLARLRGIRARGSWPSLGWQCPLLEPVAPLLSPTVCSKLSNHSPDLEPPYGIEP